MPESQKKKHVFTFLFFPALKKIIVLFFLEASEPQRSKKN